MASGGVLVGRGYVSIRPEFEGDWSRSVNSRASSAGRSGAGAFSKAFGAGLKGIGALAGVAIAANLSSAAAGAAALAPALATAGAAAGALKLGLSGVGDAFKAAFADSSSQASSAASATKAVESAQRGLANAQRALADARVQAAQRVADAQKQVESAERDLSDAQRNASDVQKELNGAREEASRALEDMNTRLKESQLDERDAAIRLTEAQKALAVARANPGTTPEQLAKLQLAYDRATLNLQEQQTETKRLSEDTKKANKAGIEGSQQVLQVKDRIAQANQDVADKERALADAQAGVAQARQDGARQIADAQRAVADAAAAVADAQAAAAAQTSKLDQAMAKLAPNARSFVNSVRGLAPAWTDMRLSVQNELFKGLDSTVTSLGRTTIPILKRQLTATAGVWNAIAKNAASGISEMAKSGMLDKILSGATKNLAVFKDTPKQIITAFGQLSVAAQPAFNKLLTQFAGAIKSFTDGIAKSFESGGLQQAIDTAFKILSQFGTLLGNAFGVVVQIFKAASDAGGQIVGVLGSVFGELKKILASDEMQASLRSLFKAVAQIVSAIVPVIGSVVQAVVPLMAAIAQPIAQLATVLGPVLQQLATTLGAVLTPIVKALGPVLVTVGTAIVQLVQAVMPLLEPIAALITAVIDSLTPALTPIISVVSSLVDVLIGPLYSVVRALTPALVMVGEIIASVFTALEPLLAPLVTLIGQVAKLVADVFAAALTQLMSALQPLIPVGMQLITTVLGALQPLLPVIGEAFKAIGDALLTMLPAWGGFADAGVALVKGLAPLIPVGVQLVTTVLDALLPVLPTVADAFVGIATALAGIAGPMAEMASSIAQQFAPILADIAPILGDFVTMLADTLAQVLPPLTTALLTLVTAFTPLLPVIAQLAGMILEMAAGVLVQLLPSILQLVQAGVDLAVALLPLVPPLAQLVVLVLDLAINVLSWLLPPLLSLADFLIGGLASALSTVIGWISGMVTAIAGLVSWITKNLVPAFQRLRDKGIEAWNKLKSGLSTAWGAIKTYVLYPIRDFFTKTVPGWATTLKNKVVGAFNGARDGLGTAWGAIKRNVLYPIRDFFTKTIPGWGTTLKNGMVGAFDAARKGIKIAWDKLKDIAKVPVAFVVNTVYNDGLRKVWNLVTDAFGGKHLDPIRGFATGGIMPGYTPGRDVHLVPSTAGPVALSGGEAIMRPEWTRAVGPGYVEAMNAAARQGGVGGVRGALGFKDGGIFSGIGDALGGAWDKVKSGYNWLKDTFGGAVKAGVKHVVYPLIDAIPGGKIGFVGMLKDAMKNLALKLVGAGEEGDKRSTPNVKYTPSKGVEQWRPVVLKALHEVGQPVGLAQSTLRRMQQESGGNPNIVNKWDSNWQAGHPSVGLMQVIRGTFQHYAGKYRKKGPFSYGVSVDPLANIYSSMKYALGAYGSLSRAYDRPGGYDSGGWLGPGQSGVNNLRQPEAVLTPAQWSTMTTLAAQASDPVVVEIHTRDRALADFIDVRVHRNNEDLLAVINAS
ncbi:transglycosylase SLT domain-containing protein [Streptomyces sp. NPDC050564]|uniref:transglycosylase SLT domain-containing protein n=1 Tax=Streptomyces sp. NPDC050564 TaxID=3365631 RepID=UPI0037A1A63D